MAWYCTKVEDQLLEFWANPEFSLVNIISMDEIDFEDRQVGARLEPRLNHGIGNPFASVRFSPERFAKQEARAIKVKGPSSEKGKAKHQRTRECSAARDRTICPMERLIFSQKRELHNVHLLQAWSLQY